MSWEFRPAQREGVGLFICLPGSSRTGKTFSALRLARGIAGPSGRIAAIDTEGKRMSHYKPPFQFDVANMLSPFTPARFVEGAKKAQADSYDALVVDSFSLEWSGVGGVLDLFDREHAKHSYAEKWRDNCWAIAKRPHKSMMNELIQLTIPIVFCCRANEVPNHLCGPGVKDVKTAWKIEQDKRFIYEWTVSLTLHPDTPGQPRFDMVDAKNKPLWKVEEQHAHLFPAGQQISEEAGAALQEWRNSDAARAQASRPTERKRTWEDWLADTESELEHCPNRAAVETRIGRDDIVQALAGSNEAVKIRINRAVARALQRVSGNDRTAA